MATSDDHRSKAEQAMLWSEQAERQGRLNDANLCALRAVYHELRHGNDKQDAHTKAIEDMTKALDRLARSLPDN